MTQFRTLLAISVGRLAAWIISLGNWGSGTTWPGHIALYVDPLFVQHVLEKSSCRVILVAGTNGKTTTASMIRTIIEQNSNERVLYNAEGANLLSGVASVLITRQGDITSKPAWCVFECDENALMSVMSQTSPAAVVLLNLFRDQLDRYGEIDKLRKIWAKTTSKLDKKKILVINSDDPQVANLGKKTSAKVYYFGITDQSKGQQSLPPVSDAKFCPNCQTPLQYLAVYVYHMGKYQCPKCAFKHPRPTVLTDKITKITPESVEFELTMPKGSIKVNLAVGGLYNVYNALAAATTAQSTGISLGTIKKGLEDFRAAFGRIEKFNINHKVVYLYLVKNPAGFNEVIKTLFNNGDKKDVLIAINDLIADGRDVSWLWDVDYSKMYGKIKKIFSTGIRAYDMALRLKYDRVDNFSLIDDNIEKVVKRGVKNCSKKLYVLPTYTAMLEIRKILNQMGHGVKFWED